MATALEDLRRLTSRLSAQTPAEALTEWLHRFAPTHSRDELTNALTNCQAQIAGWD